jgi:predicted PurR-regulated permease PerM
MHNTRAVEFAFFFGALGIAGYMVWQIFAPFITALALSAIIVVICYPLYEFFLKYLVRRNRSMAAFLTTVIVFLCIVTPISLVSTLLVHEFVSFYHSIEVGNQLPIDATLSSVQTQIQQYIPGFSFNFSEQIKTSAAWFTKSIGAIFAGTVSFVFAFLIAILGSFYLFRDGKKLVDWIVSVSPLKDSEDTAIFNRVAGSVRAVVTGTVLVSIIQGIVAAVGFSIFGIDRAILWGSIGALGGLLPGIGTAGIMIPAVAYLFYTGAVGSAIGLMIWGITAIVVVDNFIGPHLMSRGSNLHPFIVLVSVLGGVSLFGPIGFILGPVCISLFMVLLEIYGVYMDSDPEVIKKKKSKN